MYLILDNSHHSRWLMTCTGTSGRCAARQRSLQVPAVVLPRVYAGIRAGTKQRIGTRREKGGTHHGKQHREL